ncbi:MAG TPA: hypothetical protein VMU75_06835 [Acidimicrobiales bacterium]|nr:hypothetical protein [Acidimicrobiales bacterium]
MRQRRPTRISIFADRITREAEGHVTAAPLTSAGQEVVEVGPTGLLDEATEQVLPERLSLVRCAST